MRYSKLSSVFFLIFSIGTVTNGYKCYAIDYFIVIDTSGSMAGSISRNDRRPRLKVVQSALGDFIQNLPADSNLTLIPFNSGITEIASFVLSAPGEKEKARYFVDKLRASGETWLWSTAATTLERAKVAHERNPASPVMVWILTDGEDTQRTLTLERVLSRFPQVDGQNIIKSLVLLGDMQLYLSAVDRKAAAEHKVQLVSAVTFQNITPPVIDWTPKTVKVGSPVTFEEKSGAMFKLFKWTRNGQLMSLGKSATTTFEKAGKVKIGLTITTPNGAEITTEREIDISENERAPLNPRVKVSGLTPEPGERIVMEVLTTQEANKIEWLVDGSVTSTDRTLVTVFNQLGSYSISARAIDEKGISETSSPIEIVVQEPKALAAFAVQKKELEDGEEAQFLNTSSSNLLKFQWDFGDGVSSSVRDATHVFRNPSRSVIARDVMLTGWTIGGRRFESTKVSIQIHPEKRPQAAIELVGDKFYCGQQILLVSKTTGASSNQISWTFSNEVIATGNTAEVSFDTPGEKIVTIKAVGPTGLADSTSIKILVEQKKYDISLNWLSRDAQGINTPQAIYFDEIPSQLVSASNYRRPMNDTFQIGVPLDLPAGSGYTVELISESGESGFQIADLSGETARVLSSGLVRSTGRFRAELSPTAKVAKYKEMLVIAPQGMGVSLNGKSEPIRLQVIGAIVEPLSATPWVIGLGIPILGGLAYFILKNLFRQQSILTGPVDISIGVIPEKGQPSIEPKTIRLDENEVLYLGREEKTPRNSQVFDLNAAEKMLVHSGGAIRLATLDDPSEGIRIISGKTIKITTDSGIAHRLQVTINELDSKTSKQ